MPWGLPLLHFFLPPNCFTRKEEKRRDWPPQTTYRRLFVPDDDCCSRNTLPGAHKLFLLESENDKRTEHVYCRLSISVALSFAQIYLGFTWISMEFPSKHVFKFFPLPSSTDKRTEINDFPSLRTFNTCVSPFCCFRFSTNRRVKRVGHSFY